DHFSGHADVYRHARPHYDPALFAWLAAQCATRERAWDAGCGNGQASVALAAHFAQVVGTDPSAAQIANAESRPNVEYRVERAEACSLPDASVDLVTVAQALHWFDLDAFHGEVRRVLRPGGVVAQWSYADCRIDAAVDAVKNRLYLDVLDAYWAPERRLVESGYRELAFPFERIDAPAFELRVTWNLAQFLAYLRSWSATQKYLATHGVDPVGELEGEFARAWGDAARQREVVWDLAMRVGRV
ncbi:MAG TPA: class I SAM-dependent methyltransferase, partial [Tahibacter sp.]|nr:class I SAM-dependent methyltransferase [Tahibacter sp.]